MYNLIKSINILFGFFSLLICFSLTSVAQKKSYKDSLTKYQQNYVAAHEVVGKADKKYMQFYDIDERFRVTASFKKIDDKEGFYMSTSSGKKQKYYKYGLLTFKLL